MILTTRDQERLVGLHPDLVRLVHCSAVNPPGPFMVNQGLRTTTQQAEYVAAGTSQTMNSRHLTGHAVDLIPLVDGQPTWEWDYYYPFAEYIKAMAQALCTEVDWGGDWTSLKDGPHWELTWAAYPLTSSAPADEVVEV